MGVNVNFKRGSQASLNTLIAGSGNRFVEGTFYLTTDTDRLYFAQSASELVDLNQYIHIFSGLTLPTISSQPNLEDGDVYYWKDLNILAIYNGTAGTWTQINPDTYLESSNQNITFTTDPNNPNVVQLEIEVKDTNRSGQNGYGGNTSRGTFTLAGGTNVSLSQSGSTITISSTDTNDNALYTLSTTSSSGSSGGIIQLNGTGTSATNTSIAIKGESGVNVSSDTAGNVTISCVAVSDIEHGIDSTGHGVVTTLTTSGGPLESNAIVPIIYYGNTASPASAVFSLGTPSSTELPLEMTLDVYTKAQVDALISHSETAMDAMQYAGTVTSSDAAQKIITTDPNDSTLPAIGTTYKVADDFNIGNLPINPPDATITRVKAGDMLIANGTQDGNVTWDLIPSGDDLVIGGSVTNNGIVITDHSNEILGIGINGSTSSYGTIAVSSTSTNNINTLTISHGAAGVGTAVTAASVTANTTLAFDTVLDIPIVTGISKDAAGHITNIALDTYRFKDTHNYITNVGVGVNAATTASATVNISVDENDNTGDDAELIISSNNLEITSTTANNVNIDLVWGSF